VSLVSKNFQAQGSASRLPPALEGSARAGVRHKRSGGSPFPQTTPKPWWKSSLSLWVGNLEGKVPKLRDDDLLEWIKRDLGDMYVQKGVGMVRDY
jgi:hypothetical protein